MLPRALTGGAILVALFGILSVVLLSRQPPPSPPAAVQGRANTVLFAVIEAHGLSNVHVATAYSLLEHYPNIDVHFVSFPALGRKLERISSLAKRKNPSSRDIIFHPLSSEVPWYNAVDDQMPVIEAYHPPGLKGIRASFHAILIWFSPWSVDEYFNIYQTISQMITDVDPAVVVLDTFFLPALDATRDTHRLHAFITPNTLDTNFLAMQPWGGIFWKYPGLGTGYPFPLPWSLIPANIIFNLRTIFGLLHPIAHDPKIAALKEKGIKDPSTFYNLYRQDAPWITQTLPGASVPVDFVPENVTCTGPIVMAAVSAVEQDPELVEWAAGRPTLVINLGTAFKYEEHKARAMAEAIKIFLDKSNYQVLWKYAKYQEYDDSFLKPLEQHIKSGRARVTTWLEVDPPALLQSGHISAAVHHGGAGCYHDTVAAGLPHVILPMWVDTYNFAQAAQDFGIGVWACREESADMRWTVECLSDAFFRVTTDGEATASMREKAKALKQRADKEPGRDAAARIVAELAASGY